MNSQSKECSSGVAMWINLLLGRYARASGPTLLWFSGFSPPDPKLAAAIPRITDNDGAESKKKIFVFLFLF